MAKESGLLSPFESAGWLVTNKSMPMYHPFSPVKGPCLMMFVQTPVERRAVDPGPVGQPPLDPPIVIPVDLESPIHRRRITRGAAMPA